MTVWDRVVRQPGRSRSGEPQHADEPDATGNAVQRKIAPLGGMVTRRLVRHATSGPAYVATGTASSLAWAIRERSSAKWLVFSWSTWRIAATASAVPTGLLPVSCSAGDMAMIVCAAELIRACVARIARSACSPAQPATGGKVDASVAMPCTEATTYATL